MPERAGPATQAPGTSVSFQSKGLRHARFRQCHSQGEHGPCGFAAKGIKITVGQSLELIAEMFGLPDWNTLAAAMNAEKKVPEPKVSPVTAIRNNAIPAPSADLDATLNRANGFAGQRNHQYATLEHLLLALVEDADASAAIVACNDNPSGLTARLVDYLDHGLTKIVMESHAEPKLTAGFQRVIQRAEVRAKHWVAP